MEYRLIKGEYGLDLVDTILNSRGLTINRAKTMLSPPLDAEESVLNYLNLDKGIKLLNNAIKNNKKIVILADVDCDGCCSCAIIYQFIRYDLKYSNIDIITQRVNNKAHGLTEDAMEQIYSSEANLVITPDSSSGDSEKHKELESNGINCLILDHHIWDKQENLNGIVIINNQDGNAINKSLSGSGVTYKFIKYYADINNIDLGYKYLDLVAISLVSDVCDMGDNISLENRLYYNLGTNLDNITNKMLKAFINKGNLGRENTLTYKDIAFSISPNINSVIRLATHEDRMELIRGFAEIKDDTQYENLIRKTESYKRKQKKLVDSTVETIKERIKEKSLLDNSVLIINCSELNNTAINGLIATKLAHEYKRPCIMFNIDLGTGLCSGSARTYGDLDFKSVCEKTNLFESLNGHTGAFGHSIYIQNLIEANNVFNKELDISSIDKVYEVDAIIDIRNLDINTVCNISNYSNLWCNNIKEPMFAITNIRLHSGEIQKYGNATYSFKANQNLQFSRFFCSKAKYEEAVFKSEYPYGTGLLMDIVCKFTKNNNGYAICEIIDWNTKVDNEIIF